MLKTLKFLCPFLLALLSVLHLNGMQSVADTVAEGRQRAAKYLEEISRSDISPQQAYLYADSLEGLGTALIDTQALFHAYKIKGDLALDQDNYNQAVYWYKNAIEQAERQQDTLSSLKALHNLGMAYHHLAKYDLALEHITRVQILGENYLNSYQKATVLDNMGLIYSELGQYQKALSYAKQSLELLGEKDLKGKAIVNLNIGANYRKKNDKENALEYLRQARKLYEAINDEEGIARALNELALVYLKENPEISVEYLKLAKKLYVKNKDKSGLFKLNKSAGEAYAGLGDHEHALIHFNVALDYADSLQNSYYKGDVYLKMAGLYELMDDYPEAADFYKKYIAVEKEINTRELANKLASTQASFEIGQKESLIRSLEKQASIASDELRSKSISIILMIVLSLLVFILTVFFILKFRNAAKTNKVLVARNQLILSQKEELSQQRDLIDKKNRELEHAHFVNEEYNQQLLAAKQHLEEKVRGRTRELEETYRKLSFHINNTPLAVLEWNSCQELIHWPSQAEGIFGYTADEMLGLRIDEVPFLLAEDRLEMQQTVAQLSSGELARQYFTKLNIDRSGRRKYVEWSYSVLLNQAGELESVLTIANDVSLREQAYRALKTTNQELDTFLYKSSHDLRGPIARMQGIINLGLMDAKDENARNYFNLLNKVTEEFNTLLLRLLMVHNITQHEYNLEDISFRGFVDGIIRAHENKSLSYNPVNIVNKVADGLVLKADPLLLNIALVNLLENSLLFSDNFNPYVEFDAIYLPSGKYIVTVTDNGMGIPLQYQEKIFDMFFQGSSRSTGTGLGLYMVRKAINRLGGDIRLMSENGHTVFEITLPAVKNAQMAEVEFVV